MPKSHAFLEKMYQETDIFKNASFLCVVEKLIKKKMQRDVMAIHF